MSVKIDSLEKNRYRLIYSFEEITSGSFKQRQSNGKNVSYMVLGPYESITQQFKDGLVDGVADEVLQKYVQQFEDVLSKLTPDSVLEIDVMRHFNLCSSDNNCRAIRTMNELIALIAAWKKSPDGTFEFLKRDQ